ncbi:hypothetical protein [Sphingomonas sp. PB4P5]|uniref:hypothetical protein n=1 Tax=Parasphingomonas puruogangriensis TaxID=3096155 RepID=UPI002FC7C732
MGAAPIIIRATGRHVALTVLAMVVPLTAYAQNADPVTVGGPPPGPCVEVDIAGHRAGQLDCASDRLRQAARLAQAQARAPLDTPVLKAGAPDVRVGVASLPGTRLRMGNALGNSVHPQRPPRR